MTAVTTVKLKISVSSVEPASPEYSIVQAPLTRYAWLFYRCSKCSATYSRSVLHPAALRLTLGLQDLHAVSFDVSLLPREAILHTPHLPKLRTLLNVSIPTSHLSLFTNNRGHLSSLTAFSVILYDWPSAAALMNSMCCQLEHRKVKCISV